MLYKSIWTTLSKFKIWIGGSFLSPAGGTNERNKITSVNAIDFHNRIIFVNIQIDGL